MNSSAIVYTLAQVAENNGKNGNRAWIVVKNNVYDITDFLNEVNICIVFINFKRKNNRRIYILMFPN